MLKKVYRSRAHILNFTVASNFIPHYRLIIKMVYIILRSLQKIKTSCAKNTLIWLSIPVIFFSNSIVGLHCLPYFAGQMKIIISFLVEPSSASVFSLNLMKLPPLLWNYHQPSMTLSYANLTRNYKSQKLGSTIVNLWLFIDI